MIKNELPRFRKLFVLVLLVSLCFVFMNMGIANATSITFDSESGKLSSNIGNPSYSFTAGNVFETITATGGIFGSNVQFNQQISNSDIKGTSTDYFYKSDDLTIPVIMYKCVVPNLFGGGCVANQTRSSQISYKFNLYIKAKASDIKNGASNINATLYIPTSPSTSSLLGGYTVSGNDLNNEIVKAVGKGSSITINGSSKTETKAPGKLFVVVDISGANTSKKGTYGPIAIMLVDSSGKKYNNESTISNGIVESDVKLNGVEYDSLPASPPTYTACIADNNKYCAKNFNVFAGEPTTATISLTAEQAAPYFKASTSDSTTCAISGVGWIICPVIRFFANVADVGFTYLSNNFLSIDTSLLNTDPNALNASKAKIGTGTYTAWGDMRSFANIILIIVFLVIIFSQISGFGINNYGVKKLLPKLIVAAILINISFIICQISVDLSNILGFGLKTFLSGIVSAPSDVSSALSGLNWTDVAGSILAGTAVGVGAVIASGSISLALISLIGILISAVIAIIMIFFMLIIRQMLIILLVVMSPIAFVLMILPNTKKIFDQWKKIFIDLLLLFPIIGLIFGASTLASNILKLSMAQSGDTLAQIIANAVLILPLFLVPTVLKGSLKSIDKLTASGGLGGIGAKINGATSKLQGKAKTTGDELYKNSRAAQSRAYKQQNWALHRAQAQGGIYSGDNKYWQTRSLLAGKLNGQEGGFGNLMSVKGRAAARVEEEAGIKNAMSVVQDLNTKEMNDLLLNNGNAAVVATKHHINPSDISTRRALIRAAMKDNTIGDNEELIAKLAGNKDQSINEELANGIRSNKLSAKAIYLDNNFANQVQSGTTTSANWGEAINQSAADYIEKDRISAEAMPGQDRVALERLANVVKATKENPGKYGINTADGDKENHIDHVSNLQRQALQVATQQELLRRTADNKIGSLGVLAGFDSDPEATGPQSMNSFNELIQNTRNNELKVSHDDDGHNNHNNQTPSGPTNVTFDGQGFQQDNSGLFTPRR